MSGRSRNWCFTLHDPDPSDLERTELFAQYYCWGREKCPTTGRIHLQGYIELKEGMTIPQVKKKMGLPRIHLESRRGTQLQAIDYCKKGNQTHEEWEEVGIGGPNFGDDADFFEFGEKKKLEAELIYELSKIKLEMEQMNLLLLRNIFLSGANTDEDSKSTESYYSDGGAGRLTSKLSGDLQEQERLDIASKMEVISSSGLEHSCSDTRTRISSYLTILQTATSDCNSCFSYVTGIRSQLI